MTVKNGWAGRDKNPRKVNFISVCKDGSGFANNGKVDSVDFTPAKYDCEITFKLPDAGDAVPRKMLIGEKGLRPEKVPFTLSARPIE